jgi:hypothetical protein
MSRNSSIWNYGFIFCLSPQFFTEAGEQIKKTGVGARVPCTSDDWGANSQDKGGFEYDPKD